MAEITIIGGGIAGLVAAISVAEQGESAVLYEASPKLGGRARTEDGPYRPNLGPHALYHGAFSDWMMAEGLCPEIEPPKKSAFKLARSNRVRMLPLALLPMLRTLKREAPIDLDYRTWAHREMSRRGAEAAIGFASLPTFHGDPGSLSAAFVHERIQRSFANPSVSYPKGGFGAIIESLAFHARKLGVRIETGQKLASLPDGPVIVATDFRAARRLLDDPTIDWPAPRTAMFDIAIETHKKDRTAVLDVDRGVYISDYSAYDPTLAPSGQHLYQCCAGLGDGEELASGLERIRAVLDFSIPNWKSRCPWKRQGVSEGAGAADPPGTSWRDRPAISRGNDRWLVGDRVAAPGILCEVAFNSAREAAREAVQATRSSDHAATIEANIHAVA
jgi:phytoene dehydrogenase-like protein